MTIRCQSVVKKYTGGTITMIEVNINTVRKTSKEIGPVVVNISTVKSMISSLENKLDNRVLARSSARRDLLNTKKSLMEIEVKLRRLQSVLSFAADRYLECEETINNKINQITRANCECLGISTLGSIAGFWNRDLLSLSNFLEIVWKPNLDFNLNIGDCQDTTNRLSAGWSYTVSFIEKYYNEASVLVEAGWIDTVDDLKKIEWKEAANGLKDIVDGFLEAQLGTQLIKLSAQLGAGSGGLAIPLSFISGVGGAYMIVDGANKVLGGAIKITDSLLYQPFVDNWDDPPNFIEEFHKKVLGEKVGSNVYSAEQLAVNVTSVIFAAKSAPREIEKGAGAISSLIAQKYFDMYGTGENIYKIAERESD